MIHKSIRILVFLFISITCKTFSQTTTISGKISENNEPLPGVTVKIKSKTTGTSSNFDGVYTITAQKNDTLVFSYIGMVTVEKIATSPTLNIEMTVASQQLNEVVVTAIGQKKEKQTLGYSITKVEGAELTKARETNVVNSLAGRVAGVNITNASGSVGGATKIILRGESSFNGTNQPIFIVDGFPISNSTYNSDGITGNADIGNRAGDIAPDDIENISVLKGAAASALYGSRAKNGAIVITTKKAKRNQKMVVEVNSSYKIDTPLRLPQYQNEYAQGQNGIYNKNKSNGWGPKITDVQDQTFEDFKGDNVKLTAHPNNVKDFFQTGSTAINNIAISGGNAKSDTRLTFSNLSQNGIVPESEYNRRTFTINTGQKFSKKFSSRINLTYTNSDATGLTQQGGSNPNNTISQITGLPRTLNINDLKNNYITSEGEQISLTNRTNNPYWVINKNPFSSDLERINGGLTLDYQIAPNFTISNKLGLDTYNENRTRIYAKGTIGVLNGAFSLWDLNEQTINNDLILSYNKKLDSKFTINALAGHNVYQHTWKTTTNNATDLRAENLYTLANAENHSPTSYYSQKRIVGIFGDVTLDYNKLLYLELTGRNDWSSTLPSNNNSYFYPSASLDFIFGKLLPKSSTISFGKIRLNYASVGSDTRPYSIEYNYSPASQYYIQYGLNNSFPHGSLTGFTSPTSVPNTDLKPQFKEEYETGIELGFFKNRINLDFTYYKSTTYNQIMDITTPLSTGYYSQLTNVGSIGNNGIEIMLNIIPVQSKNFLWSTSFNFSKNNQKIISLADDIEQYVLVLGPNGMSTKANLGEEISIYGNGWKRNENGEIIINETSGLREIETDKRLGNINPDWRMGINNTFTYKDVSLNFLIDVKQGGIMYSGTSQNLKSSGLAHETLDGREDGIIDDGVIELGDGIYKKNDIVVDAETYWSNNSSSSNVEDNIYDASYVKLRELSIFYNFPSHILKKTFINTLKIGLEGRNLWLIHSNSPHVDPESTSYSPEFIGAPIELSGVPSVKSMGLNIQMKF